MRIRNAIRFLFLLPLCQTANAGEVDVALGIFNIARDGGDIQLNYRADKNHWQYFLRYMQFEDLFIDPYSGNQHSKTWDSLFGPGVNYLFLNESRHSAYVGISLLEWTRTETPILVSGPSMTASRWDPYFGGGYQGRFGRNGYYNAGIFIAPTASLETQIAISSTEQSGNFDIQLQVGFAW
jgi:hypothetical protein